MTRENLTMSRDEADRKIGRARLFDKVGMGIEFVGAAAATVGSICYSVNNRPKEAIAALSVAAMGAFFGYMIQRIDRGLASNYRDNPGGVIREYYRRILVE